MKAGQPPPGHRTATSQSEGHRGTRAPREGATCCSLRSCPDLGLDSRSWGWRGGGVSPHAPRPQPNLEGGSQGTRKLDWAGQAWAGWAGVWHWGQPSPSCCGGPGVQGLQPGGQRALRKPPERGFLSLPALWDCHSEAPGSSAPPPALTPHLPGVFCCICSTLLNTSPVTLLPNPVISPPTLWPAG